MAETKYGKYIVNGANLPPRFAEPPPGERTGPKSVYDKE